MAKISQGRLDGVWGMAKFSTFDLYTMADEIEAQISDPENRDDPKWLIRRAKRIRKLAEEKESALEHKLRQGKCY